MEHVNATSARKNLYTLIAGTNRDNIPVHISSPRGNAVLVSEEDWNSMQETLYLHAVPGLVPSIKEASHAPDSEFTAMEDMEWK